jgi:hypothetical protein
MRLLANLHNQLLPWASGENIGSEFGEGMRRPASERNLSIHEGRLVSVTERDAPPTTLARGRLLGSPLTPRWRLISLQPTVRKVRQLEDVGEENDASQ